jgi:hypothetical protein
MNKLMGLQVEARGRYVSAKVARLTVQLVVVMKRRKNGSM